MPRCCRGSLLSWSTAADAVAKSRLYTPHSMLRPTCFRANNFCIYQQYCRPPRRPATVMARALTGKTVVVTGASQGIGLEFANQLLQKGNTVIAAVRNPSSSSGLQQLQQSAPADKLHITTLDVSDSNSIQQWAATLRKKCPNLQHIHVLINNAGIYGPDVGLEDVTSADMTSVFVTNAVGPLLMIQQLLKQGIIGGPGGKTLVANVTSKMGSVDDNGSGGDYPYRASKAALNIINKSLSIDLAGDGITSVLLHPDQSVAGMLSVLERDRPLNGQWYSWDGKEIPW